MMAEPLRAVLVGCGAVSRAWLSAITAMDDLEIVGLVDLDEDVARERAREYELTNVATGTDLGALLDQLRPAAVFDCTVPAAHRDVALTALEHGCHLLGEKPLALSLDDARQMIAAAGRAGKIHAIVQNRRYDRNIRRLRAFLQSGALGTITTVTSGFYIGAHFGGFRDHLPHVLLMDMAIHTFDAARYLLDTDPLTVYCKEWNPAGSWYDDDAAAVAIFELSGGIVYTYHGSWCAEGVNTTWEADWRIVGTHGTVTWDGAEGFVAQTPERAEGIRTRYQDIALPPLPEDMILDGHAGVIQEFVRCVREKRTPQTVSIDNIRSLAMVLGAIESAEQNSPISILL